MQLPPNLSFALPQNAHVPPRQKIVAGNVIWSTGLGTPAFNRDLTFIGDRGRFLEHWPRHDCCVLPIVIIVAIFAFIFRGVATGVYHHHHHHLFAQ